MVPPFPRCDRPVAMNAQRAALDTRAKAFLAQRFSSSPKYRAYLAALWDRFLALDLPTEHSARFTQVEVTLSLTEFRRFASFDVLRSGREAGKRKRPPVECANAVEPGSGRASDFRLYYPCVTADKPTVPCDLCFRFPRSVLSLLLVSQKATSVAGSEAGVDCGTALAKQARLDLTARRRGGASSHVHARQGRPSRSESRKSGSQCCRLSRGQAIDKPRFQERKWIWISFSPAWISFSLGLDFLQLGLGFPSARFGIPSARLGILSRRAGRTDPAPSPVPARERRPPF